MWYRSKDCREQDFVGMEWVSDVPTSSNIYAPICCPGTPLGSAEDRLARASLLHLVACTAIRVARFPTLLCWPPFTDPRSGDEGQLATAGVRLPDIALEMLVTVCENCVEDGGHITNAGTFKQWFASVSFQREQLGIRV